MVVNLTSFLGPLWPALVDQRLQGGAAAYGLLNAAGVVGGIAGGLVARPIERTVGTGRTVVLGWASAGLAILGIAVSTSLTVTILLESVWTASAAVAGVASFSMLTALAADEVRGRVFGISRSVSTVAIPLSALAGAWLADALGVVPMFILGSAVMLLTAVIAFSDAPLRRARV